MGVTLLQTSKFPIQVADLFQQQHTEETRAKEHKEPGWSRFNNQSKLIILCAMTTNSLDAAISPTSFYTEFCSQHRAFNAHNYLLDQFEAHGRARLANPSQGMSSALYAGFIRAPTPGIPENLGIFFIPKRSTNTSTNVAQYLISHALKTTKGSGLD